MGPKSGHCMEGTSKDWHNSSKVTFSPSWESRGGKTELQHRGPDESLCDQHTNVPTHIDAMLLKCQLRLAAWYPPPGPPFSPSLINLMVSVYVKHHVYLFAVCSCPPYGRSSSSNTDSVHGAEQMEEVSGPTSKTLERQPKEPHISDGQVLAERNLRADAKPSICGHSSVRWPRSFHLAKPLGFERSALSPRHRLVTNIWHEQR